MSKKLTTAEFIERANDVHGGIYDYSTSKYINAKTKITIVCPIHNEFTQRPDSHLRGVGCPKCGHEKSRNVRITTETEFISRASIIHNNRYSYKKTKYIGMKDKIIIICPEHGAFIQRPDSHLQGSTCPKCSNSEKSWYMTLTTEEFITRAETIHDNIYDYSLVDYINNSTKVCIICPEHGTFWQDPANHLRGCGCSRCSNLQKSLSLIDFLTTSENIHCEKYDYSNVIYVNAHTHVKLKCKKCNKWFWITPANHLYHKCGCPNCKKSKGELQIESYLIKHNIAYIGQYKFIDCKNKLPLPFDFFLTEYNILIEYDGEQHFNPINFFGGVDSFNKTKLNDQIKTDYANKNNIDLLRIPYTDLKNIPTILSEYFY